MIVAGVALLNGLFVQMAEGIDDATWARGRGWALSFGLIALPYYKRTNPTLAGIARNAIDEAVADHASTSD